MITQRLIRSMPLAIAGLIAFDVCCPQTLPDHQFDWFCIGFLMVTYGFAWPEN